ncbi:MAG: histidine kinase [Bacteroidales bacterium]|nr:histidine kinase [Bacteroidales bacterium]
MVGHGLPFHFHKELSSRDFIRLFIVALLAEVTIFAIVYLIFYMVRAHNEVLKERERTHQAEFRYMTLKQQVNPHFLFNCLNILDSLVIDGEREDASRYIHKLAGIYRYMLQHEGENLVRVSDELYFAGMYYELLQVRFPEGLQLETDVREEDRGRFIVPCTLQLLIENATKHNAISPDNPLKIRISSDGNYLSIENNLIPKASPVPSTGLGIKYITRQYRDSATDVRIEKTAGKYTVHLPLL